ncbi:MAG: Fe-S cluster assembly ATPase SufC [Pseudomonadota bacterium]|jgi:Fe-S cluster assembly ATP-binding protein
MNRSQAPLLHIESLFATVQEKPILKGVDLTVGAGQVHAIMGPNGSGKTTLAKVLAGHPDYQITEGSIRYNGHDTSTWSPEKCAWQGIFLGFQYPVAIPGVSNAQFLRASLNALRKRQGQQPLDAVDFLKITKEKMAMLGMAESLLTRSVNEGFSGGEKKRNEILQMLLLEPRLAILDETDSGLDIDALKIVAQGVNALRNASRSIILITHYQRLLDYIEPDYIHVLSEGKIVHSGDKLLAQTLEAKGYSWLSEAQHVDG